MRFRTPIYHINIYLYYCKDIYWFTLYIYSPHHTIQPSDVKFTTFWLCKQVLTRKFWKETFMNRSFLYAWNIITMCWEMQTTLRIHDKKMLFIYLYKPFCHKMLSSEIFTTIISLSSWSSFPSIWQEFSCRCVNWCGWVEAILILNTGTTHQNIQNILAFSKKRLLSRAGMLDYKSDAQQGFIPPLIREMATALVVILRCQIARGQGQYRRWYFELWWSCCCHVLSCVELIFHPVIFVQDIIFMKMPTWPWIWRPVQK